MNLFYRYMLFAFIPILTIGIISTILTSRWDDEEIVSGLEDYRKQRLEMHVNSVQAYFLSQVKLLEALAGTSTVREGRKEETLSMLRTIEEKFKDNFEALYVNQPDGTVEGTSGKTFNISDRYFFPQFQARRTVITKVLASKDSGRDVVVLITPVYNAASEWIGGIGATILVEQVLEQVAKIELGKSGFAVLIDEDGRVLSRHREHGLDQVAKEIAQQADRKSQFKELKIGGQDFFLAFQRISPLGWSLGLLQTKHDAFRGIPHFREANFLVLGICGLLTILIAAYLSQRTLKAQETARRELERRLLVAEKMESLGVLAGGVAHDFNNILTSISGFTELAAAELREESVTKRHLFQVMVACRRARDLVDRILTFSQRREISFAGVNIKELVDEVVLFIRSSLPPSIRIEVKHPEQVIFAHGDATQLFQVLLNLSTNAAYAMRDGGGVLSISVSEDFPANAPLQPEHGFFCVSIRDTGSGMSEEQKARIFEPFFTTKPLGKGSGLGLSVVHGVVKAHHGIIEVKSGVGDGTEFRVFLPRGVAEKSKRKEPSLHAVKAMKRARILVIDDESSIVTIARLMLEAEGFEVDGATNAKDALGLVKNAKSPYSVIVTDHSMPEMSGLDLAESLLAHDPESRIILCTGYAAGVNEEVCKQRGFKALISKPYTKSQLISAVEAALPPQAGSPKSAQQNDRSVA